MDIPQSHPRYKSLTLRHQLVDGFKAGLVTDSGLIAHGRGEAFDYLYGEKTWNFAQEAIAVTSALLLQSRHPVFSINGNTAAIAGKEVIELAKALPGLTLEVNLFYHTDERSQKIADHLRGLGAIRVVESSQNSSILSGIASARRKMNIDGMTQADLVLVALEDGDRCEALVKAGYQVVSIDLNPMSRSAQSTQVTIVDELTRALPAIGVQLKNDRAIDPSELTVRIANYNNRKILNEAIKAIRTNFARKESL
jgi:4-phosphopantoate--beta-alanine ligase